MTIVNEWNQKEYQEDKSTCICIKHLKIGPVSEINCLSFECVWAIHLCAQFRYLEVEQFLFQRDLFHFLAQLLASKFWSFYLCLQVTLIEIALPLPRAPWTDFSVLRGSRPTRGRQFVRWVVVKDVDMNWTRHTDWRRGIGGCSSLFRSANCVENYKRFPDLVKLLTDKLAS